MSPARGMPVKCSAVISDVDGTLVTDNKVLTARAQAAAAELRTNGIIFSIISSRPPRGLRMLLEPLGITTPVGGFNGGVTPDLTVIAQHLLSPEIARRAVDMLDARGAQVWIFSGQDWLVRRTDGPYVGLEERTVEFGPTMVEDFGPVLGTSAKIVGVSTDFELLAQCERDVACRARRSSVCCAFAALLSRHYASARQQRLRVIRDRKAIGCSVGRNRRYRRRRQ